MLPVLCLALNERRLGYRRMETAGSRYDKSADPLGAVAAEKPEIEGGEAANANDDIQNA